MTRLQKAAAALVALVGALVLFSKPTQALIQVQQDQIGVTILVNVTPAPLVYVPAGAPAAPAAISARFALRARGSADSVDDTKMLDVGNLVAQTQKQSAVKVQAAVTPNPKGTLLYSNQSAVAVNGVAGTTVKASCIYTVTVDTTKTSWTLREGLSANLASSFPGSDVANDSYLQSGTPQPKSTPFIVYPTNWTILSSSGLMKTYCVDLYVTIPASVTQGAYSTNAIYTLFY